MQGADGRALRGDGARPRRLARKQDAFDAKIAPPTVQYEDPKTSTWSEIMVTKDDGVRAGVTAESLSRIKPAFAKDGNIYSGNAS